MNKLFTDEAWADYLYWQQEDKKTLRKINALLKDIDRNGNEGLGKPEALSGDLTGFWSRRINSKDRLIYTIRTEGICIIACRFHYGGNTEKSLWPAAAEPAACFLYTKNST